MQKAQFRTPHIQETQNLQNQLSGYRQPVAQSTISKPKSLYNKPFMLTTFTTRAEQISTSRTDPSLIELLNQQQAL